MRYTTVNRPSSHGGPDRLEELMAQIGRLMRHRAYRRDKVVSSLLLKHLPQDAGYAWKGESALRDRLQRARLDERTIDHLIANARTEYTMMMERITA